MAIDLLSAMRFCGRDRLPAWVVRMRSVLCFMIPTQDGRIKRNVIGARIIAPAHYLIAACSSASRKFSRRVSCVPSPQRGEGQDEGVRTFEFISESSEPPHPDPLPSGEREQKRS